MDQLRRAAVSVTSNIAEGFGRHSYREKANFYRIAQGSLTELENQILLSHDISYLDEVMFNDLKSQLILSQRLVGGLLSKTKSLAANSNLKSLISILLLFLISNLQSPVSIAHASTIGMSKPGNYLGLVGWWTFDGKDTPWTSATAATTLDKSGNGNTGTLTNMNVSTATVAGKVGQGLRFDGTDDYVDTGTSPSPTGPFTVSLWVKFNSPIVGSYVVSKQTGTGVSSVDGFGIVASVGGSVNLVFTLYQSDRTSVNVLYPSQNKVTFENKWRHVVAYYDGSNINVCLDAVCTTPVSVVGFSPANSQHLIFGRKSYTSVSYTYGSMDDVRVYNRALSVSEIQQLFNMGK